MSLNRSRGMKLPEDYRPVHYVIAQCTWSRNLDQKFCPGRGLNLGPLTWQSSIQPLDHRAPQSCAFDVPPKLGCSPITIQFLYWVEKFLRLTFDLQYRIVWGLWLDSALNFDSHSPEINEQGYVANSISCAFISSSPKVFSESHGSTVPPPKTSIGCPLW